MVQPGWQPYQYRTLPARQAAPAGLGLVLLGVLLTGLVVIAVLVVSLAAILFATRPSAGCTQRCPPPQVSPIPAPQVYSSTAFGYQVDYPAGWSISQKDAQGAVFQTSRGGVFLVRGQRAGQSDAQLVQAQVNSLPAAEWHSIQAVAPIRGAQVGYQDGAGTLYAANFTPAGGRAVKARLAVVAASRVGIAISAMGIDGYDSRTASGIPEDETFDYVLSQVRWPG